MLEELARRSVPGGTARGPHLLTFDAEHWYEGYRLRGFGGWEAIPPRDPATVERLLELLDTRGQRATFFATGRFAAEFPDTIRAIAVAGHEVASHGFEHTPIPRLGGPEAFRDDLRRSLAVLSDLTGRAVAGFRAPCWSITEANRHWVLEVLLDEGLRYDSSHFAWGMALGARAPLGPQLVSLADGRAIWEVPPSVLSVGPGRLPAAGGFYLRAFPEVVVHAALAQATRAGQPGLVYLHPYDMDAACPRLPSRWYFTLMRYHRLARTEGVLRRLLQTYRFVSIQDWLAERAS